MSPLRTALCALAAALAAGCSLLPPAPDTSRFFVLTALSSATADASSLALGVGPVRLAGYLAVPEIQVRASATELLRSPVDRWSEPLEEGVTRVLAQNLSAELGTREVVLFPWYAEQQPAAQVSLTIRRFELEPDGAGALEARYEVADLAGQRGHVVRDFALRQPAAAPGLASSVAALSEALAELSRRIAGDVRALAPR